MGFSIGGLVSGMDTDSMVAGLVAAASKPKEVLQSQKAQLEAKQTAYATLSARLTSLQTSLASIDSVNELRSVSGTSSNEDAVSVSLDGDAVIGRFNVSVTELASAEMEVSSGFSNTDIEGTFATGTLSISYGSSTTAITIDAANSSLEDVVDLINDQVNGVTAYIMDTGSGANRYRLVVSGDDTGAANAISFDTSGLSGPGTVPTFTEASSASNATLVLNGETITSATNAISGAVQGVTFTVSELTTSNVTVTVDRDTDAMIEKMQSLVDSYNAVMSYVRTQTAYNPDENIRGAFIGESQHRSVTQGLQTIVATGYSANTVFTALSQLGLSTEQNGDLAFDSDAFKDALDEDFDAVVDLITDSTNGFAAAMTAKIDYFTDEDNGLLTGRGESLEERIEVFEDRITDFEDRMEAYEARLKKQFLAMELAMARFNDASSQLAALMPDSSKSKS
jgi:flagellar hook-associated protein 2